MYKVSIFNDDIETVIHSPYINGHKLESGVVSKEINKIDSFAMSFFLNSPAYSRLKPFKTLVKVFNTKNKKYEFEGRVLNPNGRMDEEGLHTYSYTCEGELGYLHDSQQRHLEYRGRPEDLFITLLDYHNGQVEEYKKFYPGQFEVTTSTDNIYIYLSAEKTTFEEIEDKILDRIGGELRVRQENGKRYLDILERIGEDKQTEIRIAKNLKSISQSVDPTEIITRFTPLGERIESEDEEATDASQARLTIESVNKGVPYIDRQDLIDEFGIIGGSKTWDDITLPNRLLSTGQKWMNEQKVALYQYELTAVDLSLIGLDIDSFIAGNSHPVINPVMGIDDNLRIVGKSIDINNPEDDKLKIGDKFKSLDEYQIDANKSAEKVIDLESTVTRQNERVKELSKASKEAQQEIQILHDIIENMDIGSIDETLDLIVQQLIVISDSINDIGYEITDLDLKIGILEDFKVYQEHLNHQQELKNDNFDQRLQALEGGTDG